MPRFGTRSTANLETCHPDLQTILKEAIKYFDFSVIFGYRSSEEQHKLFEKGRKKIDGKWLVIYKLKIVTYKDGFKKLSKHNIITGGGANAVDIIPWPEGYKDTRKMDYLAGIVKGIAWIYKSKGIIDNDITWGADWDNDNILSDHKFVDRPHFQIK